jgi:hypothetical protein
LAMGPCFSPIPYCGSRFLGFVKAGKSTLTNPKNRYVRLCIGEKQGGKVKRLCREVCLVPRKLKEAPRWGACFCSSGGFR